MMGSAKAFFFFRMMMMGSVKAESCVDEVGFFLDQQRSGIFTRDKSDLGKVTCAPKYVSSAV